MTTRGSRVREYKYTNVFAFCPHRNVAFNTLLVTKRQGKFAIGTAAAARGATAEEALLTNAIEQVIKTKKIPFGWHESKMNLIYKGKDKGKTSLHRPVTVSSVT